MWMNMNLFKRETGMEAICAGSVYRRVHRDRTVETATVLSIGDDSFGIPHVRYQLSIGRSDKHVMEEGPRMLSLSCFAEQYREPQLVQA
ncbi:MAG: hypothetical protein HOI52_03005 [Rhodospirillales bacterium]|jgi:hypothetical protein|nr:hypothetical protein [Rhodospirillales bacterium]MBT6186116.1 hypothetical protein [Rhodospirillales bacterium]